MHNVFSTMAKIGTCLGHIFLVTLLFDGIIAALGKSVKVGESIKIVGGQAQDIFDLNAGQHSDVTAISVANFDHLICKNREFYKGRGVEGNNF